MSPSPLDRRMRLATAMKTPRAPRTLRVQTWLFGFAFVLILILLAIGAESVGP